MRYEWRAPTVYSGPAHNIHRCLWVEKNVREFRWRLWASIPGVTRSRAPAALSGVGPARTKASGQEVILREQAASKVGLYLWRRWTRLAWRLPEAWKKRSCWWTTTRRSWR